MLWPVSTRIDDEGRVLVGGVHLVEIADQHGSPCLVVDAEDVRGRCRTYRSALPDTGITYAAGTLLSRALARYVDEAGLGIGVGSAAELTTALAAGVGHAHLLVHGAALPPAELAAAVRARVGLVVLESPATLRCVAAQTDHLQPVLLRVSATVTAGGDPTAVGTGVGVSLSGGQVTRAAAQVIDQPRHSLRGLHLHLGGRITSVGRYRAALTSLLHAAVAVRDTHGIVLAQLHLGGGQAVPTAADRSVLNLTALSEVLAETSTRVCAERSLPTPRVVLEPGRGVVERAGVTLLRVLAVRDNPDSSRTATVDGTTGPDPRTGLPGSHDVALVSRPPSGPQVRTTVLGRSRAPGDVVTLDAALPADLRPGDLVAAAGTGAGLACAAACSVTGRPPVVAVDRGVVSVLLHGDDTAGLLARDGG